MITLAFHPRNDNTWISSKIPAAVLNENFAFLIDVPSGPQKDYFASKMPSESQFRTMSDDDHKRARSDRAASINIDRKSRYAEGTIEPVTILASNRSRVVEEKHDKIGSRQTSSRKI